MLISVILPVYNVSKYLPECMDSIINQTYSNLEIICVNDCSTDNSLEILEQYAGKDSRIKIINNPKNIGAGLSRNTGLMKANGEFVHFLDPDDWLELNAYEIITKYITDCPDAVRFTYTQFDDISKKQLCIGYSGLDFLYKSVNIYNTPECFRYWSPSEWVKLYKREFLIKNNILYNDNICLEDVEHAMKTALRASNIVFIEENLLNYRANRRNSLLTKRTQSARCLINYVKWANNEAKKLPSNTKIALLNYIYEMLVTNCVDAYYDGIISYSELKEIFKLYIDSDIFKKNDIFNSLKAVKLYEYVSELNYFRFFLVYNCKRFVKEHFPILAKIHMIIKKRLKKC